MMKNRMVLAVPDPLLTPPSSSSPRKTPHWSHSAQTPIYNRDPAQPPPGGCGRRKRSRGTGGQDGPRAKQTPDDNPRNGSTAQGPFAYDRTSTLAPTN
jgi:hypothetical protein